MRIQNNVMAMNAHRQYGINNAQIGKSTEKLSSGYRINRAGDDAAGLAISEKMRAQIRGLTMASKNSQDAISLVQTAEGALQESHNILQRMRELAVQSASDSNETTIDRAALQQEFSQLIAELDDTANKARFNDQNLIDGTFSASGNTSIKTSTLLGNASAVLASKTGAGTYKAELAYTASTMKTEGGEAPSSFTSSLGGTSAVASFDFTLGTIATEHGSITPTIGDKIEFTGAKQGVDGNQNEFELTFKITSVAGATEEVNVIGSFNPTSGAFTANGGPFGHVVAIGTQGVSGATATLDEFAASLKDLVGASKTIAATPTASQSLLSAGFTAGYTAGAITQKTDMYNGDYTIKAEVDASNKLNLKLIGADGNEVSSSAIDVSTLVLSGTHAAVTLDINLGQFGKINLETDADATVTADMIAKALNNKTISITGGVEPDMVGDPASATLQTNGGEFVDVKVGMSQYTDEATGVTIKFDHKLTEADFADEATLQKAVFGSASDTATVKVDSKEGKALVIQTGANEGDNLAINIDKMDSVSLDIAASNVSTREAASAAITEVNSAINKVSTQRAALGALQNRLDHKISNLDTSAENLTAAESRIRDVDMAKEMTKFTKNNILFQASTAMLAQANAAPQGVLQLLG